MQAAAAARIKGKDDIHMAARRGKADLVLDHLAADPGCVTKLDEFGWTPLNRAANCDRVDICAILIAAKADVNPTNGLE
jgi:ankyrin repeat protein